MQRATYVAASDCCESLESPRGTRAASVLFSDAWENPVLSPRDRSQVTNTSLIALYRINEMPFHPKQAFENGVTRGDYLTSRILRWLATGDDGAAASAVAAPSVVASSSTPSSPCMRS
jgi:alkylhydroperoxidase/carboxymuconolactone decarboxylase family protein YurZ